MTSFNEMADRFGNAEIALNLATQRLEADKERRKGSLLASLVDFVSKTDAEEAERKAREEFERVSDETRKDVAQRLHRMAMAEFSKDADEARRRANQAAVCERTLASLQEAERVLGIARNAHEKLAAAASACSSASTVELIDALSSNKGVSAMSSFSTSSAKSKLTDASEALKALSVALPGRTKELGAQAPDDLLDLVLDLVDFPIDFLSWSNKWKLDAAEEKCKESARHMANLVEELGEVVSRRRQAHEQERALLATIDRPYLLTALEHVPATIRFAVPEYLTEAGRRREDAAPAL
ncbi:hypothetical protein GOB57_24530 [Sinorhizobium meliloti]|nr:hypothetical protein [Sinorhizobium meliloti]